MSNIHPKKSFINIRDNEIILNYTVDSVISEKYLMVYFDGIRIDVDGSNGKVYNLEDLGFETPIYEIENFQIVPTTTPFDNPECPEGNMFQNFIKKDLIHPNEVYKIPVRPLTDSRNRNNYIDIDQQELGLSIRRGILVRLNSRQRFVDGKIQTKSEKAPEQVISIQDYRYIGQHDPLKFKPSNLLGELNNLQIEDVLKAERLSGIPAQQSVSKVILSETSAPISDIGTY